MSETDDEYDVDRLLDEIAVFQQRSRSPEPIRHAVCTGESDGSR